MKNKTFYFTICIMAFSIISTTMLLSQDKTNGVVYGPNLPLLGPDKTSNIPEKPVSQQVQALVEQQKLAKQMGNISQVMNIQKQLDALTGDGYTTGDLIVGGSGGMNTYDNVINTNIFNCPSGTYTKALTMATEQRGATAGRIWAVFAYGTYTFASPDTLHVFYSDNGGTTWFYHSYFYPGSFAKVNADELDLEIIENTTGNKYLWLTLGITANNSQEFSDLIVIQAPTFAFGFYTLSWPGGSNNTNYYRPRVTSDNSYYLPNSYAFIISARDTVSSGNFHKIGEKFVRCNNPYTTAPILTYKGSAYYFDIVYGGTGTYYQFRDQCDIAYIRNNADSLIVTESNLPDTTVIYCAKSNELPETYAPVAFANLNGAITGQKQYARIASNGNPFVMIAYRNNFANTGDWDIRYISSSLGGIAANSWANGYIDGYSSTTDIPYQPDLAGLRGSNSFKVTYTYYNSGLDSAMLVSAPNGIWATNERQRVSATATDVSATVSPHVSYRLVNNDSCMTLWTTYSQLSVWVASGCTGTQITGITNNRNIIPNKYSLEQNYPNPFNPSTTISFGLPKAADVNLIVYDITGRVVAELVNGKLDAGMHSINFDASRIASGLYFYSIKTSDFTETKKMMLIK